MAGKPTVMLGLMSDEVVQHHVKLGIGIVGHYTVHEVEELPSPLAAVVGHTNLAGMHLKGSEEGRSPVPLVLVSMPPHRLAVRKAQPPLSSFQGLDGRLLIDADHHCVLGRVQVQTHYVRRLLGKLRIGAHAPTATPLKVDTVLAQHTPDMDRRDVAKGLGQQLARPRRVPVRRRLVQLGQNAPLGPLVVYPGLARPGSICSPLNLCLANRVRHLLTVAARVCNLYHFVLTTP